MKFSPRVQMIAALAVSTVLVSSMAVVVGTNYVATQESAQAQVIDTIAMGNERVQALTERAADLELAIENAQAILTDSSGKVLDDSSRAALEKSIAQAQQTLKNKKQSWSNSRHRFLPSKQQHPLMCSGLTASNSVPKKFKLVTAQVLKHSSKQ